MWSWSSRNRRAALAMLSWSSPTLNAITARHSSAMPCLVTHSSATSDSCIASVSVLTRRPDRHHKRTVPGHDLERQPVFGMPLPAHQHGLVGRRHVPTKHATSCVRLHLRASGQSGNGVTSTVRADRFAITSTSVATGRSVSRVGHVGLRAAADVHDHLTWPAAGDGMGDGGEFADDRLVDGHDVREATRAGSGRDGPTAPAGAAELRRARWPLPPAGPWRTRRGVRS